MAKHYHSDFDKRQEMKTTDFEIFYYEDKEYSDVSMHRHDYYEIYYFLEGDLSYQIGKEQYPLLNGDICIIPPGVFHRPLFKSHTPPYRRIVLWLSPNYYKKIQEISPDITYCFDEGRRSQCYHYATDFASSQVLFDKLIDIMEENKRNVPFHTPMLVCHISSLLLSISRIVAATQYSNQDIARPDPLFSRVCEYMNKHLEDDLSLDMLAQKFYVSKYHISHVFKENMGMSVHQYLSKKRLYASKNSILAGEPLKDVAVNYGFKDYTSFFRAFKKEFGIGPKEYKEHFGLAPQGRKEAADTIEHAVFDGI